MSNGSGQSENSQLTTQASTPNATSSGPKRLAGRHTHQYRPITIGAAVRYPKYRALATGRSTCSLVSAIQTVMATMGRTATPTADCIVRGATPTEISGRAGMASRCRAAPFWGLVGRESFTTAR
jgi:hypothetical protein